MALNFYPQLLSLHGFIRWIVLAAAFAAIVVASSGWTGNKPVSPQLRRFSVFFVVVMDIEFVLGLLLYFWASPITRTALQNMAAAMKEYELRFFAVEHAAMMFLAVILAHLGGVLVRRGHNDRIKYRGALISYVLSLLLMLAGIPWWRPLFRIG